MSDFSQDIKNFVQNGTYTYAFDSVGNLTFNVSSSQFNQVYLAMKLDLFNYNNTKINNFYKVDFQEFIPQAVTTASVPTIGDLQSQLDTIQQKNNLLQSNLNSIIAKVQSTPSAPNTSSLVTKQVILELRKALGQGTVDADFSPDFPYTSVTPPTT